MIRTLRAFFLGRLLREKLLLVAFALLGVVGIQVVVGQWCGLAGERHEGHGRVTPWARYRSACGSPGRLQADLRLP